MTNPEFALQPYFDRIHYQGPADASVQTLFDLHTAHTLNIPFENLAIFQGRAIDIDGESLYKKIVLGQRGGYCFEMNGLFAQVLRQIGFRVQDLLARVFIGENEVFAKLHHVLLVEVEGRSFLADVGFGGNGLISPLEMICDQPARQFSDTYKLVKNPELGYVLQYELNGKFNNLYAFTLDVCRPVVDYLAPNFFCSRFPGSIFTQQMMCTKPTSQGRITLSSTELKIRTPQGTERHDATQPAEFSRLLDQYFGLQIDAGQLKKPF